MIFSLAFSAGAAFLKNDSTPKDRTLRFNAEGKFTILQITDIQDCLLFRDMTKQYFEYLLDTALYSNMNMIRIWGGGYYDRFLDNLREADIPVATVGLVFSACRAELLPREDHDIPVHTVIDERRITHTHGAHSNP